MSDRKYECPMENDILLDICPKGMKELISRPAVLLRMGCTRQPNNRITLVDRWGVKVPPA